MKLKKLAWILATLLIVSSMLLAACQPAAPEAPAEEEAAPAEEEVMEEEEAMEEEAMAFKACQVTDVGGIDDKSFNATAWKGMEDAMAEHGIEAKYLESQQQTDYEVNINAFVEEGCDLIVAVGFLLGDATAAAAEANPDQKFAIVDVNWLAADNLYGSGFAINEATFLAGYLAAGMTQTGVVATYGGIQIPPVEVFMDGFVLGVEAYNAAHGTEVQTLGWDPAARNGLFVGNFESTDDGRTMGESLMDEGADIIMPVAGPVGAGTLAVMEERGAGWIIGVDNDWTVAFESQAEYVLASALKNMDLYVHETIDKVIDGTFEGGNYLGTLENGGVGLGYGAVEVPDDLKAEIDALVPQIVAGDIATLPAMEEMPAEEEAMEAVELTLAIEHFSIIEGTTWSGAHNRAGERLAEKYDNVTYVYREEVMPDVSVPFAEEMIADDGADIVVGNAEFMGMPLAEIAEKYPDVNFVSIIGSDPTSKANFLRVFPRQYQALYLEGLVAGALTETGNVGIVSAFPVVQVIRRTAGFYLGVMDAAELLGKDITVYAKYAGDWYAPPEERAIAETLVDQYNVDVITQQTDSGSALDVAIEKGIWFVGKDMDITGFYGWGDANSVAISFDTRWEVLYNEIILDMMAGEAPDEVLYLGMESSMTLADGTEIATVDIMNDGKVGIEAISPVALPLIPQEIVDLVDQRRTQMMAGEWDPFTAHALVSNGTGLELEGLPVPAAGEEVKAADTAPTDAWLLFEFNFDLEGMEVLE